MWEIVVVQENRIKKVYFKSKNLKPLQAVFHLSRIYAA